MSEYVISNYKYVLKFRVSYEFAFPEIKYYLENVEMYEKTYVTGIAITRFPSNPTECKTLTIPEDIPRAEIQIGDSPYGVVYLNGREILRGDWDQTVSVTTSLKKGDVLTYCSSPPSSGGGVSVWKYTPISESFNIACVITGNTGATSYQRWDNGQKVITQNTIRTPITQTRYYIGSADLYNHVYVRNTTLNVFSSKIGNHYIGIGDPKYYCLAIKSIASTTSGNNYSITYKLIQLGTLTTSCYAVELFDTNSGQTLSYDCVSEGERTFSSVLPAKVHIRGYATDGEIRNRNVDGVGACDQVCYWWTKDPSKLVGPQFEIVSFKADNTTLACGQTTNLRVVVKNTGKQAGTASVALFFKETGQLVDRKSITLNPGQSGEIVFTFTAPNVSRSYTLCVSAT